jgi:hypothetical protein
VSEPLLRLGPLAIVPPLIKFPCLLAYLKYYLHPDTCNSNKAQQLLPLHIPAIDETSPSAIDLEIFYNEGSLLHPANTMAVRAGAAVQ